MNKLLRSAAALFSIGAGVLHWDIWANHGYRFTPVKEMFVASAAAGVVLGLLALIGRRWWALPAVVANAAFLGAFALSRLDEVPTFHGGWSEKGLAPKEATLLGISTVLVLVVSEGLAVTCGLASLLFGGSPSSRALPSEFARV